MNLRWNKILLDPNAVDGGNGAPSSVPSPASQVSSQDMAGDLPSFNPNGGDQGAGSGTAAPGDGGLSGAQPVAPGGSLPADPNNRGASQQSQAAAEWQSVRDALARYGYQQASQFQDDEAALVHLMQQAQRAQQADLYAQIGRQIAPHIGEFQQFQQQRQQATQQPPAYMPPEFDERWLPLLERDPATGVFYGKPGCPPQIVDAANKRAQWNEQFAKNPAQFFEAYAKDKFMPTVQQMVQQQLAAYQQSQTVDSIIQQNSSWLYQRDNYGRTVMGPNGPVPTPVGQAYIQQVEYLNSVGVRDPRAQDQIARQLVAGMFAQGAATQQQQRQAAVANPLSRQAQTGPNVNPRQARPPMERQVNGAPEPDGTGLSLAEMLARSYDQAGLTDADFALD